jgi:pimeloyl-ACP methyl ester carboxylesterase
MKRTSLFVIAAVVLATAAIPALAGARGRKVASYPVTFTVQNLNRSLLPCATDGRTYKIRGHVTGPRSALANRPRGRNARTKRRRSTRRASLYLHGLGLGEWFWTFKGLSSGGVPPGVPVTAVRPPVIPGYDYAGAQARRGHVSVTVDRLGYDSSDYLDGNQICLGGHADIAHQVVQALRTGRYEVGGTTARRFARVALVGHSLGAQIAMIEAYSFRDVDALVDVSFSFQNLPRAQLALGPTRDACLKGGQPPFSWPPGGPPLPLGPPPGGYAAFGTGSPADFQSIMFRSGRNRVVEAATTLRNLDPCGDIASIIPALLQQQSQLRKIKVPVLVICGTRDALFAPLGCRSQAERFEGSRRVEVELVRGAGHAVTLERQAATFRRKLGRWLKRYR